MRGFDPAVLLNLVQDEQITQIFGLPMMYRAMLDHPAFAEYDLSSLRRAVYAMAPMPDDLIRRSLTGFGCDFALLFGQTEMSPCTTLFRPEHQLTHIGAVGTPITGVRVAVMLITSRSSPASLTVRPSPTVPPAPGRLKTSTDPVSPASSMALAALRAVTS